MNIKLLEEVKAAILEEPRRVNMDTWLEKQGEAAPDFRYFTIGSGMTSAPPCGTVGCIAGWAVALRCKKTEDLKIDEVAQKMLKLKTDLDQRGPVDSWDDYSRRTSQRDRLFMPDYWPERYQIRLRTAKLGTKKYARVVADRIDFFIKTKGTDVLPTPRKARNG